MRKITFFKTMLVAVMLLVGSVGIFGQYTGTGTFSKITTVAEIESGAYYVLYGTNGTYTGALSNEFSSGKFKASAVTTDGNSIVNPAATIVWKIAGDVTNGYTIYNESYDKFCEITTSSTSGFAANNPSTHTFTATVVDGNFTLKSNSTTGDNRVIALYQTDFRSYATGNTLHLYKLPVSVDPTVVINPIIAVNGIEKTPGVYFNNAQVTLTTETAGASIYYTLNGDEPTTSSTLYTAPFSVAATSTVKALAVKSGMNNSSVIQRLITIVAPAIGTLPFEELFTSSLGDFYAYSKTGDQVWGAANYSSGAYTTFAKVSGFSGSKFENEDWLITPKFTASSTLGLQLSFASATNSPGNALQLKYSTNYSGYGDPSTATWTDITSQAAWPAENSGCAWVESGNIVIAGTIPVHFAFIYTSTTAAATWEVANLKVINVPIGPTITVSEVSVPDMMAVVGASGTETIHVSGVNLTAGVSLAVSGKNANRFSVNPATLTQTGGVVENTEVTITYTPAAEEADTATLTVSSAGTSSVVLELTGKGIILIGAGTTEKPFTVADVKKLNNSFSSATKYWVRGYIVGVPSAGNSEGNLTTVDLEPPFTCPSAIALSDVDAETDLTKMIGVQLLSGSAVRAALNLVDNPANYKKLVKVYGTLEAYFTAASGVKNTSEYQLLETSLPTFDAAEFKVYTTTGQLHVEALESSEMVVFDVIGKQIYKGCLHAGHNAINLLHRGVMVVKINNRTAKVVM